MPDFYGPGFWTVRTTGPPHVKSDDWLTWVIRSLAQFNYIRLDTDARWGIPFVEAKSGDPSFHIVPSLYGSAVSVRIPVGAAASLGSDATLVGLDREADATWSLWGASYDPADNVSPWRAKGTSWYRLSSDGLCTTEGNSGHRGIPPLAQLIRSVEIAGTAVLKRRLGIFLPGTYGHVWPMCAGESGGDSLAPPEGAVLRIRADVDLSTFRVTGPTRKILRALKERGAVVADRDGSARAAIKCQPTNLVTADALSVLPLNSGAWEFAE